MQVHLEIFAAGSNISQRNSFIEEAQKSSWSPHPRIIKTFVVAAGHWNLRGACPFDSSASPRLPSPIHGAAHLQPKRRLSSTLHREFDMKLDSLTIESAFILRFYQPQNVFSCTTIARFTYAIIQTCRYVYEGGNSVLTFVTGF